MNQPNQHPTMSRRTTNHNVLADFDAAFANINIAPTAAMDATLTDANNGDPPSGLYAAVAQPSHNSVTPLTPILSKLVVRYVTSGATALIDEGGFGPTDDDGYHGRSYSY